MVTTEVTKQARDMASESPQIDLHHSISLIQDTSGCACACSSRKLRHYPVLPSTIMGVAHMIAGALCVSLELANVFLLGAVPGLNMKTFAVGIVTGTVAIVTGVVWLFSSRLDKVSVSLAAVSIVLSVAATGMGSYVAVTGLSLSAIPCSADLWDDPWMLNKCYKRRKVVADYLQPMMRSGGVVIAFNGLCMLLMLSYYISTYGGGATGEEGGASSQGGGASNQRGAASSQEGGASNQRGGAINPRGGANDYRDGAFNQMGRTGSSRRRAMLPNGGQGENYPDVSHTEEFTILSSTGEIEFQPRQGHMLVLEPPAYTGHRPGSRPPGYPGYRPTDGVHLPPEHEDRQSDLGDPPPSLLGPPPSYIYDPPDYTSTV